MNREIKQIRIPFIPGDGIGPDIMAAARSVIDAAVGKATEGTATLIWEELLAGEAAFKAVGEWLPSKTLQMIRDRGISLKGPLTTPIGGGIRSLNVSIRQALDLYCSVRPVRYFEGVPSPVKEPQKMNIVIFRENTEDVYKGIEWRSGSKEALELIGFLKSRMGIELSPDSGIGIKPISEFASKRLIRAAVRYAIKKRLKSVTLVHKGNIMKFTEGAFRDWGYELARFEFADSVVPESELKLAGGISPGRIVMNDRIADNMFQQILTRPDEYSILATPNLNGDYLADACAAQIGGLGLAPGANIGDDTAVFEAVHGTAPKYAGKNIANPSSLILSGALMLEHIGLESAGRLIVSSLEKVLAEGVLTEDLARRAGSRAYGTSEFAREIVSCMG
ncbi:MAG: NADP-dependent isocitrate dehydrogenase [Thermoplasmatota archaeon]|nr:NADP-dependent isocitrate dehydrogenase [Candidatus Thermoplasmatota archaeon]MBU1914270.1 NADP-dependent isocitrate dehydrogenase [Candidatus Thermoplasmatota archaeon]